MCLITLSVCALWYYLLSARRLPARVMQYWFLWVNCVTILPVSALVVVLDLLRYVGVPRYYVQRICIFPLVLAFRAVYYTNPQIKMTLRLDPDADGTPLTWRTIEAHNTAVVGNHTSFWDVYVCLVFFPIRHLLNTRTLMKSTLREIPIFGMIFDRVGHFPVYFKSDADGNFQVDKERQAAVQQKVDEHIHSGGNIAIFPEGAVNRHPATLQTFRYGTFATIFQHEMSVYYAVAVGNEKTWPRAAPFGGLPADVRVRAGRYPVDYRHTDSKVVAEEMRAFMQKIYDEIASEMERDAAAGGEKKAA